MYIELTLAEFSSGQDILAQAQGITIQIQGSQKGLDKFNSITLPFNRLKNLLKRFIVLVF